MIDLDIRQGVSRLWTHWKDSHRHPPLTKHRFSTVCTRTMPMALAIYIIRIQAVVAKLLVLLLLCYIRTTLMDIDKEYPDCGHIEWTVVTIYAALLLLCYIRTPLVDIDKEYPGCGHIEWTVVTIYLALLLLCYTILGQH